MPGPLSSNERKTDGTQEELLAHPSGDGTSKPKWHTHFCHMGMLRTTHNPCTTTMKPHAAHGTRKSMGNRHELHAWPFLPQLGRSTVLDMAENLVGRSGIFRVLYAHTFPDIFGELDTSAEQGLSCHLPRWSGWWHPRPPSPPIVPPRANARRTTTEENVHKNV